MCVTPRPVQSYLFYRDCPRTCDKFYMNETSVVGIIWSDTQERTMSEHSNPQIQPSKLHPVSRKPSGPVIPVTTILGTSRMVPNDAVLRWPRLYWGRAAKTHTYTHTHTAANTTGMQMHTKTDWGTTDGLEMLAAHMQSIQCTCKGSMHPVIPDAVQRYCHQQPLHYFSQQKKTIIGIQLQCCLGKKFNEAIKIRG